MADDIAKDEHGVEHESKELQLTEDFSSERMRLHKVNEARLREHGCVVHDGVVYNKKGYRICGVMNQHDKPCQRIGHCPFHNTNPPEGIPQQLPETDLSGEGGVYQDRDKEDGEEQAPHMPPKKVPYKKGWTKEEHYLFLRGLATHGRGAWKQIAAIVSSRTPTQIQSHAQKYFLRQKQRLKNKRSIHDLSLNSPEMMELAAKWAGPVGCTPQYTDMNGVPIMTQGTFPNAYGGETHPGQPVRPMDGSNVGAPIMYHPIMPDSQTPNGLLYAAGSQGIMPYPPQAMNYAYPSVHTVQPGRQGGDETLDIARGYPSLAPGEPRQAPYVITQ
mmetsp:Transcript_3920/g.11726  ORF Transcript_3920/g.11726 Transcript_3920/m.11726 type:complete len:330 (+) Transcript_3920:453-1442(+)